MNRDTIVFGLIFLVAGGYLFARGCVGDESKRTTTGVAYYQVQGDGDLVSLPMAAGRAAMKTEAEAVAANRAGAKQTVYQSWPRTFGLWVAGFFTLAIFSFLYRDNPFYKIAEHIFIGISAAYYMTVALWNVIVPNLLGKLIPRVINDTLQPGADLDEALSKLSEKPWFSFIDYAQAHGDGFTAQWHLLMDYLYLVPLVLGVMLLWRLAPKGQWIARWPLAFILGTTAGIRMVGYLQADFVAQISNAIAPLYVVAPPGAAPLPMWQTVFESFSNVLLLIGTLCAIVYFFFSLEHKGIVGRASRLGIWVLMITFGAGFGFTVMGRIALLVGRFKFVVNDWLNIVPP